MIQAFFVLASESTISWSDHVLLSISGFLVQFGCNFLGLLFCSSDPGPFRMRVFVDCSLASWRDWDETAGHISVSATV
jgi:hypothetical protein